MANVSITPALATTSVSDRGSLRLNSYGPPDPLPATVFPKPSGRDYQFQARMIEEKWVKQFPALPYFMLKIAATVSAATPTDLPDYDTPAGVAGETLIDPLYLEPLPPATTPAVLAAGPQLNLAGSGGAANPKAFRDPVSLNVALRRDVKDLELKQWGFDEMRDAVAVVPLSLLDKRGVLVRTGDEFDWGDERFEVLQYNRVGYFKNATSRFFMVMNCLSVRRGS